jgi:hypothetical protein
MKSVLYSGAVISEPHLIRLLRPAAAPILEADATAITQLNQRKSVFSALDKQPAAAAMAGERRAMVATTMRKTIAPELNWELIEDNLQCGAYEWLVDGVTVRLSKTTRASRQEAAKVLLGIQGELFSTVAHPGGPRDEVLIRLMGNVLVGASVDAVAVGANGDTSGAVIPLQAIAVAETVPIEGTREPATPKVTLPGVDLPAESRSS